ncbi:MAG: hypothetical protein A2408_01145 [Candidatus Yonathbacteria bacterium RIFOXYC1_FULL_52_10]|uniref:DUF4446 domain-containing protein n=1 Tax=Candidatus Yonathbacteria bacterium RIFOXYD1_FULL_52_36 TaxID=1802730 RepID=A0A1G2SKH7_9BACT|nr:MAG: hypothetical protein A2408_01145 [Candidatus Yonathbacteria bacterium RIFOXYC1_FULL_52_10]OHA85575.1 MAG: hypothetical protein A2591_00200 [Candidatus Yonathbacteria bacterium RIFOXYD1_FULL_52_36]
MADTQTLVTIALALITIILFGWVIILERRMRRLLVGKNAQTLEDTIITIRDGIYALSHAHKESKTRIEDLDRRVKRSMQGVETVRFNAFGDAGSKQSFAIGILNEEGDGVVLSSLYARDRMSIFAKPIKAHASEHELTEEERSAIERARR